MLLNQTLFNIFFHFGKSEILLKSKVLESKNYCIYKKEVETNPTVPICSDGSGVVGGRLGFLAAVPYFILAIYHGLSRYVFTILEFKI